MEKEQLFDKEQQRIKRERIKKGLTMKSPSMDDDDHTSQINLDLGDGLNSRGYNTRNHSPEPT